MMRHSNEDGSFEITSLPGQSQVAICHSFFVRTSRRGRGLGKGLKTTQNNVLRQLHYDFAICTVAEKNIAQKTILTHSGWRFMSSFYNTRLSETTEIWGYLP